MKIAVVIPNYNSAALVTRCAAAMLRQAPGTGYQLDVVVVDDGSTDGSADRLADEFGDSISLVRLPLNRGRSTGRNAGAAATDAELLVFVDSDCIPTDNGFVAAHAASIEAGADVSFGEVCTPGPGFWDQLQRDANAKRRRHFVDGQRWVFTTQNVAILASAFSKSGGFDPIFDRHGFEDRDLFLRLDALGAKAAYSPAARVLHEDKITLGNVSRKLGEAGYHSSRDFHARHPVAYQRMLFSRLDCALHPWLRHADRCLSPLASRMQAGQPAWLEWRSLPLHFRFTLARSLYGLAYLHGTVTRWRESRLPKSG
jgi:glycosyltransferase involved in cell wall biosynthesis